MADQDITCSDCGAVFTFTESEQEFYASKELSPPKRCKNCRQARKAQRFGDRQMHDAVCSACGKDCQVPFQPRPVEEGGRPVLCRECFIAQKQGQAPAAAPEAEEPQEAPEAEADEE
jgi:CxxC-x17-CxxC domain-containing protein